MRWAIKRLTGLAVIGAAALGVGRPARADVVTINPIRDNTIYSETPDISNGAGSYLFTGNTNNGYSRRGLLAFDVASAVPAGSTVTAVTVRLFVSRTSSGPQNVRLHRVTADWGAGTSNADSNEGTGADATINDATWDFRFYIPMNPPASPAWNLSGGDFIATASATISVGAAGSTYTWGSNAALVADVQGWLNAPAGNFGWIVIGNEATDHTAKRFDSAQNATVSQRPKLTITYTPAPTNGACCFGNGNCQVLTAVDCATQHGEFQGDGTNCSPNPCPPCIKGDVDLTGRVDGDDIAPYVDVLFGDGADPNSVEFCAADMDSSGAMEPAADTSLFVDCLLGVACP